MNPLDPLVGSVGTELTMDHILRAVEWLERQPSPEEQARQLEREARQQALLREEIERVRRERGPEAAERLLLEIWAYSLLP